MSENRFPPGWDEQRVRKVLEHYESQDDQAVAEDEHAEERAFVRRQIERGLADVEAGRVVDHEDVERIIDRWLRESGQQSSD